MKPIAILQFSAKVGPGYFADYLQAHARPFELLRLDAGQSPGDGLQGWSGIALLGGPMSANDALPWHAPVLQLIQRAAAQGLPMIGHCLGAQLMARALGGSVSVAREAEIGWVDVSACEERTSIEWLGAQRAFPVFHWHKETFSLPPGAQRLFTNPCCANQAFVSGPHLGLQCHTEITAATCEDWCSEWLGSSPPSPNVQTPAQMRAEWPSKLAAMRVVADALYARWLQGCQG